MLTVIRRHKLAFAIATAAGLLLRLYFVLGHPVVQGDALVYAEIAKNVLNFGIFGMTGANGPTPTLIRLPGFPLFLAAVFKLFGQDNFRAVMLIHTAVDLASCLLIADTARRLVSEKAATIAFVLAALCPFTANYVGTPLTETLEIFFTIAAIDAAVIAFDQRSLRWWAVSGLAVAAAIQLRPDGGLLVGSIGLVILWQLYRRPQARKHLFTAGVVFAVAALLPLAPWAYRNWKVFRVFQPIPNTAAADPNEFVPVGWNTWIKTWAMDYSTTEDLTFLVSGTKIDMSAVPPRAFDSAEERQYVESLFAEYNSTVTMNPALDRKFFQIAEAKKRTHWFRYYFALPLARITMMWFRPRTEMLPLDTHWWDFENDIHDSTIAVLLGLFNGALIVFAELGIRTGGVRLLGLLVVYPIARSVLLMTLGALEDRYTLECFPMVFILAGTYLQGWFCGSKKEPALIASVRA